MLAFTLTPPFPLSFSLTLYRYIYRLSMYYMKLYQHSPFCLQQTQ